MVALASFIAALVANLLPAKGLNTSPRRQCRGPPQRSGIMLGHFGETAQPYEKAVGEPGGERQPRGVLRHSPPTHGQRAHPMTYHIPAESYNAACRIDAGEIIARIGFVLILFSAIALFGVTP